MEKDVFGESKMGQNMERNFKGLAGKSDGEALNRPCVPKRIYYYYYYYYCHRSYHHHHQYHHHHHHHYLEVDNQLHAPATLLPVKQSPFITECQAERDRGAVRTLQATERSLIQR
jgi:hypothetical protein